MLGKYLSNIISLKLVLAIFYFTICILIGLIGNYAWFQFKLLIILFLNQFIASFILYLRANMGGLHLFKTESIISVLDKTILIIICVVLLWGNVTKSSFKIEWLVYAQTFSYGITLVISLLILINKNGLIKLRFDRLYYLWFLKKSLPYALLVFLMASYYRIDSVLLERILPNGETQAGIYAHSFRILDMLQNYGFLFALILLPIFAKMIKTNESVEQLVKISFILIIVPAIIVVIGAVVFSSSIIDLLYDEHTEISSTVFSVIIPGFLGICSSYIFGTLLTANGNLKTLNLIASSGVFVSLLLNFILIPKMGVLGSAIANLSAQSITALLQLFIATRIFNFSFNLKLIARLFIFVFLAVAFAGICHRINISWFYQIALYFSVSTLVAFFMRILNIKYLYQLIRYGDNLI